MTERLSSDNTPELDRIQMHFALGKAHEDSKNFAAAFENYQQGNALKLAKSNHSREQLDIRVSTQIDVCKDSLFDRLSDVGHTAPTLSLLSGCLVLAQPC